MDKPVEQTAAGAGQTVELIDIHRIMRDIPHRYPFLMLDRVVDMVLKASAVGIKNVSANESFFAGHFPNHPVMPRRVDHREHGADLRRAGGRDAGPDAAGKVVYFMSIENAKFRRPVVPGDQLRIHVVKERNRGNVWKFHAIAEWTGFRWRKPPMRR